MTAKGVSPRPFVALAPKVAALRASAGALASALAVAPPSTLHLRGGGWLVAVYALGPHALLAYAPAPLDAHDRLLRDMDRALTAKGAAGAAGPVTDLGHLVKEIW